MVRENFLQAARAAVENPDKNIADMEQRKRHLVEMERDVQANFDRCIKPILGLLRKIKLNGKRAFKIDQQPVVPGSFRANGDIFSLPQKYTKIIFSHYPFDSRDYFMMWTHQNDFAYSKGDGLVRQSIGEQELFKQLIAYIGKENPDVLRQLLAAVDADVRENPSAKTVKKSVLKR